MAVASTSSSSSTETTNENYTCSVCGEFFEDPRSLPCGHCFCGPPKNCFKREPSTIGIKCAVCKEDHQLNEEDLKPLFGVREALRHFRKLEISPAVVSEKSTDEIPFPNCSSHPSKVCSFWCSPCGEAICDECWDTNHDSHDARRLKNVIHSLLSTAWQRIDTVEKRMKEVDANLEICRRVAKHYKEKYELYSRNVKDFESFMAAVNLIKAHMGKKEEVIRNKDNVGTILRVMRRTGNVAERDLTSIESPDWVMVVFKDLPLLHRFKTNRFSRVYIKHHFTYWFECLPPYYDYDTLQVKIFFHPNENWQQFPWVDVVSDIEIYRTSCDPGNLATEEALKGKRFSEKENFVACFVTCCKAATLPDRIVVLYRCTMPKYDLKIPFITQT